MKDPEVRKCELSYQKFHQLRKKLTNREEEMSEMELWWMKRFLEDRMELPIENEAFEELLGRALEYVTLLIYERRKFRPGKDGVL